ncbi:MAG: glycosyltransferase [Pedobacter agri]
MTKQENILFITDKNYVDYLVPGGVQICTEEFISYFKLAGYNVIIVKVTPNLTFLNRVKIKIGVEVYELYSVDGYLDEIVNAIESNGIKTVLFNQLNIAHWTSIIKSKTTNAVKFIALSHGNESGDYIHDITKSDKIPSLLKTWRLGKLLIRENQLFSTTLDAVITISEHETYINEWLGAKNVLSLPRLLNPDFIDWKPDIGAIGFIGTLDHLPNYLGIESLAMELEKIGFKGNLRLVGGPIDIGKALAQKYPFIVYYGKLDNNQLLAEVTKWSIFLNPIFWYARGSSTKVAQMINWGIPIISTKAGVRGYDLANTNFLTNKDNAEVFARLIVSTSEEEKEIHRLKKVSEENATLFDVSKYVSKLRNFITDL